MCRAASSEDNKSISSTGTLAVIRLQYGNLAKTWTRVVIEGRPDPAHAQVLLAFTTCRMASARYAQVYLIDHGTRQLVNARSLCEMPIELLRFPRECMRRESTPFLNYPF
ncbi:unnamed protein product [Strongylus vulgaris]|uniref:Tudor domain-containing protein n=1 Tax=Strongylus vulgaris TaxID=40348 RepID=A0A3P7L6M6_STRVU|nr:unnamed protein product [Strongylus vulgaris]